MQIIRSLPQSQTILFTYKITDFGMNTTFKFPHFYIYYVLLDDKQKEMPKTLALKL